VGEFDPLSAGIPWLAKNIAKELARFDPQTGRFMTGTGWAVTNQDAMLSMAYLYLTPHPGNPFHRDPGFLRTIGQVGDAVRDFQYPDGRVEFVKVDGSKWGPIYMPWTMYHWLETFHALRDVLDAARGARWEEGLRLAFTGIARELRERLDGADTDAIVHNIPTWNAMSLRRAADVLGCPAWAAIANRLLRHAVDAQDPDGYWPEFAGPTTSYNLVYVHALGLYRLQGGEIDVLPALERALRFHQTFTYPDGTLVETIDGRVKYHDRRNPSGLVGFSLLPHGRRYVMALVRRAIDGGECWVQPHFAQLLRYWPDGAAAERAPSSFEDERFQAALARAIVIKEHGWYICLSGFTGVSVAARWAQDRQSFVGVWQRTTGLVIGGGNSKDQSEWSTFQVVTGDGEQFAVPDAGAVDLDRRTVDLECRGRRLRVQLVALDERTLTLRMTAYGHAGDALVVHLPLQLHPGEVIETSVGGEQTVSESALRVAAPGGGQWVGHGPWRLEWEGGFTLEWPSFPFNPYAQDGKSNPASPDGGPDLAAAVAILRLSLASGEARDVRIALV